MTSTQQFLSSLKTNVGQAGTQLKGYAGVAGEKLKGIATTAHESFFHKVGYMNIIVLILTPIVILILLGVIKPSFIMDYPTKLQMAETIKVCFDDTCEQSMTLDDKKKEGQTESSLVSSIKYGSGKINAGKFIIAFLIIWVICIALHVGISFFGILNIGKAKANVFCETKPEERGKSGFGIKSLVR